MLGGMAQFTVFTTLKVDREQHVEDKTHFHGRRAHHHQRHSLTQQLLACTSPHSRLIEEQRQRRSIKYCPTWPLLPWKEEYNEYVWITLYYTVIIFPFQNLWNFTKIYYFIRKNIFQNLIWTYEIVMNGWTIWACQKKDIFKLQRLTGFP